MTTSKPSPPTASNKTTSGQLSLFAADSPANHFPLPGSAEARMMTATSGQKWSGLLKNSGPVGLLAKTLLDSSAWASTACYLTWKTKTTPHKRLLYRLVPSTPPTDGIASGLWATPQARDAEQRGAQAKRYTNPERSNDLPDQIAAVREGLIPTPRSSDGMSNKLRTNLPQDYNHKSRLENYVAMQQLWPTPTTQETEHKNMTVQNGRRLAKSGQSYSLSLADSVKLWPTPTQRDYKSGKFSEPAKAKRQQHPRGKPLNEVIGGSLNPQWVEWLMGFPKGWTDLEHSATLLSPKS